MLRRKRGDVSFMWNVPWRPLLAASNTHAPCSKYKTGSQLLITNLWLTWDHREIWFSRLLLSRWAILEKKGVQTSESCLCAWLGTLRGSPFSAENPPILACLRCCQHWWLGRYVHQSVGGEMPLPHLGEASPGQRKTGLGTSYCTGVNKPQRAKQELLCS